MAANIVKFNIENTDYTIRPFGRCASVVDSSIKIIDISDFSITHGATILVNFEKGNTANTISLKIGEENYNVLVNNESQSTILCEADTTVEFVYDLLIGAWRIINASGSNQNTPGIIEESDPYFLSSDASNITSSHINILNDLDAGVIQHNRDTFYITDKDERIIVQVNEDGLAASNLFIDDKEVASKEYVNSRVSRLLEFKGNINSKTDLPVEHYVGDTYRVNTPGEYIAGENCEKGDMIICIADGSIANDADWTVMQQNWTVTNGMSELKWGETITLATIGGININATLPAKPAAGKLITGNFRDTINAVVDVADPYIKYFDGSTFNSAVQFTGANTAKVKANNGVITIDSGVTSAEKSKWDEVVNKVDTSVFTAGQTVQNTSINTLFTNKADTSIVNNHINNASLHLGGDIKLDDDTTFYITDKDDKIITKISSTGLSTSSISADSIKISGGTNQFVLLAGGGVKPIDDFINNNAPSAGSGQHFMPSESDCDVYSANAENGNAAQWNKTQFVTGVNILKDIYGHVTNVSVNSANMPDLPLTRINTTTKYLEVSNRTVNNNSSLSVNLKTQTLEDAISTGNDTGLATAHNVATELANTELAISQAINSIKDSVGLENNLTIDWEGEFEDNTTIVDAIKNIKEHSNSIINSIDLSEYLNKNTGGTILGGITFNNNVLFNDGELELSVAKSTLNNTDVQKLSIYSPNSGATVIETNYLNATASVLTSEIHVRQHIINNTQDNSGSDVEYNELTFYDSLTEDFSHIAVGNVHATDILAAGIYLNDYEGTNDEYVITADGGALSVTTHEDDINESSYSLVNGQTLYNYVNPLTYTQIYYNAYTHNITQNGQPILIYQSNAFIKGVPAGKYKLTANTEAESGTHPTFVALRHNGQFLYEGATLDSNANQYDAVIMNREDILTVIRLNQDITIDETFDIVIAYNCMQDVVNDIITNGPTQNVPYIANGELTTNIYDLTLIAYSQKSYPEYLAIGINEKLNNKLDTSGGQITGSIALNKNNTGIFPVNASCYLGTSLSAQQWSQLHVKKAYIYEDASINSLYVDNDITAKNSISAAGFYETSDIRKKNVVAKDISVDRCYDVIEKCSTILYTLKDDESNKQQIGLIAQEIEEFFPEIIQTDQDGYKSIDYGRLVVVCMRVLKDMIDQKK